MQTTWRNNDIMCSLEEDPWKLQYENLTLKLERKYLDLEWSCENLAFMMPQAMMHGPRHCFSPGIIINFRVMRQHQTFQL
jgi:hypothetical protein